MNTKNLYYIYRMMYSDDQMVFGKTDYVDNTNFVRGNEFSYPNRDGDFKEVLRHEYPDKEEVYYHDISNRFYPNDLNKTNKYYKVYPNTSHYLSDFPFFKLSEPFTNANDYYKTRFMKYVLYIPITIIVIVFIICSPISSISFIPDYASINTNSINIRKKRNVRKQQNKRSNLATLSLLMTILCILYLVFRGIFNSIFDTYPKCQNIDDTTDDECKIKGNKHQLYDNCKECLNKNDEIGGAPINNCKFDGKTDISSCNNFENDEQEFDNYFVENYILFFLISVFVYIYLCMLNGNPTIIAIIIPLLTCSGFMIYSSVNSKNDIFEYLIYLSFFVFYSLCIVLLKNTSIFEIVMKKNI